MHMLGIITITITTKMKRSLFAINYFFLLNELLVHLLDVFQIGCCLLDALALHDRSFPGQEAGQLLLDLLGLQELGRALDAVVDVNKEESDQKRGNGQICKGKVLAQEVRTLLDDLGVCQQLLELLKLDQQSGAVLDSLFGIRGVGSLVVGGMDVSAISVDQVTQLGALQGILGQEARLGVKVGEVLGDEE